MIPVSEIITAIATGVSVVALSVGATLYVTSDSSENDATQAGNTLELAQASVRRYDIGDAYFPCRDHIQAEISQPVRNVNVDSHSSRYDELRNDNVVFIDLQLADASAPTREAKDAQVVCRVSAANNEITAFQLRKG